MSTFGLLEEEILLTEHYLEEEWEGGNKVIDFFFLKLDKIL